MEDEFECTQILETKPDNDSLFLEPKKQVAVLDIAGKEHAVFTGSNLIGRDAKKCDIVVSSRSVSAHHAVIEVDAEDSHLLADLGSSNRTKIGKLILRPHVRYSLTHGIGIQIADLRAVYRILQTEANVADTSSLDIFETPARHQGSHCSNNLLVRPLRNSHEEDENSFLIPGTPVNGKQPGDSICIPPSQDDSSSASLHLHYDTDESISSSLDSSLQLKSPEAVVTHKTSSKGTPGTASKEHSLKTTTQSPTPEKTVSWSVNNTKSSTFSGSDESKKSENVYNAETQVVHGGNEDGIYLEETQTIIPTKCVLESGSDDEDIYGGATEDALKEIETNALHKSKPPKKKGETSENKLDTSANMAKDNSRGIYDAETQCFSLVGNENSEEDKDLFGDSLSASPRTAICNKDSEDVYDSNAQPKRDLKDIYNEKTQVLHCEKDSASECGNEELLSIGAAGNSFHDGKALISPKQDGDSQTDDEELCNHTKGPPRNTEDEDTSLYDAKTQLICHEKNGNSQKDTEHLCSEKTGHLKNSKVQDASIYDAKTQLLSLEENHSETDVSRLCRNKPGPSNKSEVENSSIYDAKTQLISHEKNEDSETDDEELCAKKPELSNKSKVENTSIYEAKTQLISLEKNDGSETEDEELCTDNPGPLNKSEDVDSSIYDAKTQFISHEEKDGSDSENERSRRDNSAPSNKSKVVDSGIYDAKTQLIFHEKNEDSETDDEELCAKKPELSNKSKVENTSIYDAKTQLISLEKNDGSETEDEELCRNTHGPSKTSDVANTSIYDAKTQLISQEKNEDSETDDEELFINAPDLSKKSELKDSSIYDAKTQLISHEEKDGSETDDEEICFDNPGPLKKSEVVDSSIYDAKTQLISLEKNDGSETEDEELFSDADGPSNKLEVANASIYDAKTQLISQEKSENSETDDEELCDNEPDLSRKSELEDSSIYDAKTQLISHEKKDGSETDVKGPSTSETGTSKKSKVEDSNIYDAKTQLISHENINSETDDEELCVNVPGPSNKSEVKDYSIYDAKTQLISDEKRDSETNDEGLSTDGAGPSNKSEVENTSIYDAKTQLISHESDKSETDDEELCINVPGSSNKSKGTDYSIYDAKTQQISHEKRDSEADDEVLSTNETGPSNNSEAENTGIYDAKTQLISNEKNDSETENEEFCTAYKSKSENSGIYDAKTQMITYENNYGSDTEEKEICADKPGPSKKTETEDTGIYDAKTQLIFHEESCDSETEDEELRSNPSRLSSKSNVDTACTYDAKTQLIFCAKDDTSASVKQIPFENDNSAENKKQLEIEKNDFQIMNKNTCKASPKNQRTSLKPIDMDSLIEDSSNNSDGDGKRDVCSPVNIDEESNDSHDIKRKIVSSPMNIEDSSNEEIDNKSNSITRMSRSLKNSEDSRNATQTSAITRSSSQSGIKLLGDNSQKSSCKITGMIGQAKSSSESHGNTGDVSGGTQNHSAHKLPPSTNDQPNTRRTLSLSRCRRSARHPKEEAIPLNIESGGSKCHVMTSESSYVQTAAAKESLSEHSMPGFDQKNVFPAAPDIAKHSGDISNTQEKKYGGNDGVDVNKPSSADDKISSENLHCSLTESYLLPEKRSYRRNSSEKTMELMLVDAGGDSILNLAAQAGSVKPKALEENPGISQLPSVIKEDCSEKLKASTVGISPATAETRKLFDVEKDQKYIDEEFTIGIRGKKCLRRSVAKKLVNLSFMERVQEKSETVTVNAGKDDNHSIIELSPGISNNAGRTDGMLEAKASQSENQTPIGIRSSPRKIMAFSKGRTPETGAPVPSISSSSKPKRLRQSQKVSFNLEDNNCSASTSEKNKDRLSDQMGSHDVKQESIDEHIASSPKLADSSGSTPNLTASKRRGRLSQVSAKSLPISVSNASAKARSKDKRLSASVGSNEREEVIAPIEEGNSPLHDFISEVALQNETFDKSKSERRLSREKKGSMATISKSASKQNYLQKNDEDVTTEEEVTHESADELNRVTRRSFRKSRIVHEKKLETPTGTDALEQTRSLEKKQSQKIGGKVTPLSCTESKNASSAQCLSSATILKETKEQILLPSVGRRISRRNKRDQTESPSTDGDSMTSETASSCSNLSEASQKRITREIKQTWKVREAEGLKSVFRRSYSPDISKLPRKAKKTSTENSKEPDVEGISNATGTPETAVFLKTKADLAAVNPEKEPQVKSYSRKKVKGNVTEVGTTLNKVEADSTVQPRKTRSQLIGSSSADEAPQLASSEEGVSSSPVEEKDSQRITRKRSREIKPSDSKSLEGDLPSRSSQRLKSAVPRTTSSDSQTTQHGRRKRRGSSASDAVDETQNTPSKRAMPGPSTHNMEDVEEETDIDDSELNASHASASRKRYGSANESFTSDAGQKAKRRRGDSSQPALSSPRSSSRQVTTPKTDATNYQVLFTGYSNTQLQAVVTKLGGTLVESADIANVLVTDKVRRTVKFLCIVSRGLPVVSPQWLTKSRTAGRLLDPWQYLLVDREAEVKYDFNLEKSLRSAATSPLLKDYHVYTTESVIPPSQEIKAIVSSCGAKLLHRVPSVWPKMTVVISCEQDKLKWNKMKQKNVDIVSAEWLLSGVLQQQLHTETHKLE